MTSKSQSSSSIRSVVSSMSTSSSFDYSIPKARYAEKMSNRMADSRSFAWGVQREDVTQPCHDVFLKAKVEQERTENYRLQKEKSVERFQRDVKERIHDIQMRKRERLWAKSTQDVPSGGASVLRNHLLAPERCISADLESKLSVSSNYKAKHEAVHMAFQNARTLMAQKAADNGANQSRVLPGDWKAGSMRDPQTPGSDRDRTMTGSIKDFSYIFTEYQDPDLPGCNIENHPATDSLVPSEDHRPLSPCKSEHRTPSKLSMHSDRHLDAILSVKPGIENVIEQELKKKQLIMIRRLFHDLERRQVRERKTILEHNNNVRQMKSQKEQERKRMEAKMNNVAKEEKTSQSGQGQVDSSEADSRNGIDCQVKKKLIKLKENERYINALKKSIVEKYASLSQPVPALCSCANSLIDSDPRTCANNCIFYRNPKAYIQALKNLVGIARGNTA